MAICSHCNSVINDNDMYCSNCGLRVTKYDSSRYKKIIRSNSRTKNLEVISYIIGLLSFINSFIPIIGIGSLFVAPLGIVLSIIAKKRTAYSSKANAGLKFSIWATILSVVMYFVNIIILVIIAQEQQQK